MQGIAEFHKVSFSQFLQDSKKTGFIDDSTDPELVKIIWDRIRLPARATEGSAGYDFYLPYPFSINADAEVLIPTGIRIDMQPGWFLELVPRSGLGFKYGMRLVNTCAVIDSDYYFADNEGHIMAKVSVASNMCLQEGDRFVQGLLIPHGITRSDATLGINRTGGFGSTGVN